MTNKTEALPVEKIIEQFGGIRPLAKILGLSPSTVQGWKQRGAIPESRLKEVIDAAEQENIDIYKVFDKEKNDSHEPIGQKVIISSEPEHRDNQDRREGVDRRKGRDPNYKGKDRRQGVSRRSGIDRRVLREKRRKKVVFQEKWAFVERMVLSASILYMLSTLAFMFIMGPEYHAALIKSRQIDALEKKIQSMGMELVDLKTQKTKGSFAGSLNNRIEALDKKAAEISRQFDAAGKLGGMAIQGRINKLENKVTTLNGLLGRIDILNNSGSVKDGEAESELQQIIMALKGDVSRLDKEVGTVRNENSIVTQILQDVSKQDLGAAAMLVALGQFREGVNSEKPFTDDLGIIKDLIGNNPELQTAVDKLAPFAETGVLSTSGLQSKFGDMASDIIMSSADGSAMNSKVMEHLGNLVTVTKDGQPILTKNNKVVSVVNKANQQIEKGDIGGAVRTLKTLEGPAGTEAKKWIRLAKGNLLAKQTNTMISKNLLSRISSGRKLSIGNLETFLNRNFIQPLGLPKPDKLNLKWDPTKHKNDSIVIEY